MEKLWYQLSWVVLENSRYGSVMSVLYVMSDCSDGRISVWFKLLFNHFWWFDL